MHFDGFDHEVSFEYVNLLRDVRTSDKDLFFAVDSDIVLGFWLKILQFKLERQRIDDQFFFFCFILIFILIFFAIDLLFVEECSDKVPINELIFVLRKSWFNFILLIDTLELFEIKTKLDKNITQC